MLSDLVMFLSRVVMPQTDLVVALTGASGSLYGVRLVEVLLRAGRTVHLTLSPAAVEVLRYELDCNVKIAETEFDPFDLFQERSAGMDYARLSYHHYRNFHSSIASGSYLTAGMVICPCSTGTLASIAHGISENLIHRAAEVHLKERRKLVLVPRETPLSLTALRNMVAITEAGAIVLPAMPAFYTRPQSISEMIDFVVSRICDQFGIEHSLISRWSEPTEPK